MKEDEIDIQAISQSHVRRFDKWYRMCAGLSSDLVSYESGVIELEIRKSARWPKSPLVTARQLAEDWRRANPGLSDAVAFLVHIYEQRTDPGFLVPSRSVQGREGVEAIAKKIRETMKAPSADVLLATVRGRFDAPLPPELERERP